MLTYCHLQISEREEISRGLAARESITSIARRLGRSRKTISQEIHRNCQADGIYSPHQAQSAYRERRQKQSILERDIDLQTFVADCLHEGWSPEQINGRLGLQPAAGFRVISFETIYRYIYSPAAKALMLWNELMQRHKKRGKNRALVPKNTIKGRVSIHERPEVVNNRSEYGHWEADYMICAKHQPVLVLHERKSKFTRIFKLSGRTAAETISSIQNALKVVTKSLRKSMTFDNDQGFALHQNLTKMFGMKTWFCDAYASWQKGGVENTNGRLRRWLPNATDLTQISNQAFKEIEIAYNSVPRKCLGYRTPAEVWTNAVANATN